MSHKFICAFCKTEFKPKRARAKPKCCSVRCAQRNRPFIRNNGHFLKGQVAWNKGLTGFRAGEKRPETGTKISAGLLANPKPRITPIHDRIRRSMPYRKWREAVFKRDNWTCVLCGDRSRAGHRITIQADHIKPFALYEDLRLDINNGRTLCLACHSKTPTYGKSLAKAAEQTAQRVGD